MNHLNLIKNKTHKNIAIIGHMGCGKSVIGKLISKKLGFENIDTDKLIEKKTQKTINHIFTIKGEVYFRKIEEKIILSLRDKKETIISLGGGSILSKNVREFLKNNCITVFIDVDIDVLANRLEKSKHRPLLLGSNIKKKINELDIKRRKYYLLADITLKKYKSSSETLNEFTEAYNELDGKYN